MKGILLLLSFSFVLFGCLMSSPQSAGPAPVVTHPPTVAASQTPAATPAGVKDCGAGTKCFTESAKTCAKAKVLYSREVGGCTQAEGGVQATGLSEDESPLPYDSRPFCLEGSVTTYREIKGKQGANCITYTKIEKTDVAIASGEDVAYAQDSLQNWLGLKGKYNTCNYPAAYLAWLVQSDVAGDGELVMPPEEPLSETGDFILPYEKYGCTGPLDQEESAGPSSDAIPVK